LWTAAHPSVSATESTQVTRASATARGCYRERPTALGQTIKKIPRAR
jgi:hypothetical protein